MNEMISNKLTAFLFISKKTYEESFSPKNFNLELKVLKDSVNETLEVCRERDDKDNEVLAKSLLDQIINLQKEKNCLQSKLMQTEADVKNTEEEETDLKGHLKYLEEDIHKFIIDTHENRKSTCACLIF